MSKVGREFIFFRKSKPLVNKHQCCRWPWLCTQQICDIIGQNSHPPLMKKAQRVVVVIFQSLGTCLCVKRERGHNIRCIVLSGFIRMKSPPLQVSWMSWNVMVHVIHRVCLLFKSRSVGSLHSVCDYNKCVTVIVHVASCYTLCSQGMMMYQSSIKKDKMKYLKACFHVCWLRWLQKSSLALSQYPAFAETEACVSNDRWPDAVSKWNLKLRSGN